MRPTAPVVLALCALLFALTGCGFNTPKVNNAAWYTPQIDHSKFLNTCSPCHESELPPPVYLTSHGYDADCANCHRFTAALDNPTQPWLSHEQYSHVPNPASCLPCHGSLRPGPSHVQTGDCVSCHLFPTWSPLTI